MSSASSPEEVQIAEFHLDPEGLQRPLVVKSDREFHGFFAGSSALIVEICRMRLGHVSLQSSRLIKHFCSCRSVRTPGRRNLIHAGQCR